MSLVDSVHDGPVLTPWDLKAEISGEKCESYYDYVRLFFFEHRPPKKLKLKDKTQGKNSRKNPQPLGGLPLPYAKLKKKLKLLKFSPQNSKFSKGWHFLYHFYKQIFSKT